MQIGLEVEVWLGAHARGSSLTHSASWLGLSILYSRFCASTRAIFRAFLCAVGSTAVVPNAHEKCQTEKRQVLCVFRTKYQIHASDKQ